MRAELFDMIDECTTVNSNMVITKSVSRVDRNTQDSLKYIRQLKEQSIPVYFEEEYFVSALYLISTLNTRLATILLGEEHVRIQWGDTNDYTLMRSTGNVSEYTDNPIPFEERELYRTMVNLIDSMMCDIRHQCAFV